jgi:hypothetical protein
MIGIIAMHILLFDLRGILLHLLPISSSKQEEALSSGSLGSIGLFAEPLYRVRWHRRHRRASLFLFLLLPWCSVWKEELAILPRNIEETVVSRALQSQVTNPASATPVGALPVSQVLHARPSPAAYPSCLLAGLGADRI